MATARLVPVGDAQVGAVVDGDRHGRLLQERVEALPLALGAGAQVGELELGPDAGDELARGKGFGQVVVGSRMQPFDLRLVARTRGEDHHRDGARLRLCAQTPQQLEAVDPGHHRVGQHQVRWPRRHGGQRGGPIGDGLDLIRQLEQPAHVVANVAVVVDDENPGRWRRRACLRGRGDGRRGVRGPGGLGIDGARAVGAGRRQPAQRFLDEGGGPEHRRAIGVRGCDAVGGKVRRALRDVKREGGAPAERRRDGDGPLVQLHQLLHEGEPDAGTFDGPRAPALDAEEAIVKVRDVLGGDSDAGVLDAHDDGAVGGVQRHGDRPLEGELDRVRDQVEDDLLPHAAIDEDRLAERRTVDQEGEPGALDRREE